MKHVHAAMWNSSDQYRIKPKNRVRYGKINFSGDTIYISNKTPVNDDILKITFEGDSAKIIAVELINQE